MWNRQQDQEEGSEPEESKPTPVVPTPSEPVKSSQAAVLGPSITIKGTLSGDEDLLIEGRVDGEVAFKKHTLTVGKSGRIKADLHCKKIFVEGQVNGNLYGDEIVVIKTSAKVHGNAVAPRVSLEDGCHFHGSIDMQPKSSTPSNEAPSQKPQARLDSAPKQEGKSIESKPVSASHGR